MSTAEAISDVINRLYVAAADPQAWPEALAAISNLFDGSIVGINHQNFSAAHLSWTANHEFDVDRIRMHFEVFNTPAKNAGLRALITATPLQPFTISSFMTPREFYGDDGTNAILIAQNIHHGLLNVVDKDGANTSLLLYRGHQGGDYTDTDAGLSRILGVHVRNAVRLAHANFMLSLNESYQAQLPGTRRYGIALVTPRARLINADPYAQSLIAAVNALGSPGGHLLKGAHCEVNCVAFPDFLARAPAFANFFVRNGDKILQVKTLPDAYTAARFYIGTAFKGVALRLIDLNDAPAIPAAKLFGFTEAEAAVAGLMCQGLSLTDITNRLRVTRNTLKTHLRSLYAKSDTERQGELIAKLLQMSE